MGLQGEAKHRGETEGDSLSGLILGLAPRRSSVDFKHPMLRLLKHEHDPRSTAQKLLLSVMDTSAPTPNRVDALCAFLQECALEASPMSDYANIARELLNHLAEHTTDPRVVEERVRLLPEAAPRFGKPQATLAGVWLRKLSGDDVTVAALSEPSRMLWSPEQAASAIRLIRVGLLDRESFGLQQAIDAMVEWVAPLWSAVLVHHAQVLASTYTSEFNAVYGEHAQRLLLNKLRSTPDAEGVSALAKQGLTSHEQERLPLGPGEHLVISGFIPPASDKVDKEALAPYEELRAPVMTHPLPSAARIQEIGSLLCEEFPWATECIGIIISDVLTRRLFGGVVMGIPNMLLLGGAGVGKTRLMRRLAQEMGVPFMPLSLAGSHDAKLVSGTARGWAGGQPSPLVTLVLHNKVANPLVLLDEIDKTQAGGATGLGSAPLQVLLSVLERENAQMFRDPFLQTSCDLSKVMWAATANSATHLGTQLLTRFRVAKIDNPSRSHMRSVLPILARDCAADWGVPAEALPKLPDSLVGSHVGNLRDLAGVVRAYLADWALDNLHEASRH